jgi:hypothetical protein
VSAATSRDLRVKACDQDELNRRDETGVCQNYVFGAAKVFAGAGPDGEPIKHVVRELGVCR